MLRRFALSITVLVGFVTVSAAQKPGAAGTWNARTMIGPKDSVAAVYVLTVAPDGKSATIRFPGRDALPARILAMGGDSIVTEVGPYPSVLRPGQTVTSLKSVAHYKDTSMWGTFEAHYGNGDVLKGKTKATRVR
ncbi:MAG TPA: hypothetical protein VEU74_01325 [Gemmatimonadales bacterium]|nr:hypothetical protein [Gemmatimonadales bacterium]